MANEKIPENWKSAFIHLPYNRGSKTDSTNYRGILLPEVTTKILCKALLKRAKRLFLEHLYLDATRYTKLSTYFLKYAA